MIKTIQLSDSFTVSPQILPSDIAQLKKLGFKSIINNRPDKEDNNQPQSSDIAQAAQEYGLEYFSLPVISGNISADQISAFSELFSQAPKPIFAFCRTGTRCSALWLMSSDELGSFEQRLARAKEMGFDLSWVTPTN